MELLIGAGEAPPKLIYCEGQQPHPENKPMSILNEKLNKLGKP